MATYRGEERSGKLGKKIYYTWNGRLCVRSYPEEVANPRTEAQQRHRYAFAAVSKLSSDLKAAHLIGLHEPAQRNNLNTHSIFRKYNKDCFGPGGIDYARVVVSRGSVGMVGITSVEVDERRILRLTFDGQLAERGKDDEFHLFVYCSDLHDCRPAYPVPRSVGVVTAELPEEWMGHDLHLYAFLQDKKLRTSNTIYMMIAAQ